VSSSSRLVVALDLAREQYVFAPTDRADPRVLELKAKGVVGDRTLVCAACYTDHGLAVPVVVRSRQGGFRRPHFAHPPGCAPVGGEHRPETLWHLNGKRLLAQWARRQPGVVDVRTEVWLPGGERRSDVRVVFTDGRQVALEVQNGPLTDDEWTNRHEDYRRNDVVDVWLWCSDSRTHWIVVSDPDSGQQLWMLDPDEESATLMVGARHRAGLSGIPADDIDHRVPHLPPCVEDRLLPFRFRLEELELTPLGITIPPVVTRLIARARRREQELVQARRNQTRVPEYPVTSSSAPVQPARAVPRRAQQASVATQPARSAEGEAQLRWLQLQSAFMDAGHVPLYQDSPQLRRPGNRQHVQCGRCWMVLVAHLDPTSLPQCSPGGGDRSEESGPDQLVLFS